MATIFDLLQAVVAAPIAIPAAIIAAPVAVPAAIVKGTIKMAETINDPWWEEDDDIE